MARTPTAVLMTVGHIEQSAMVNSAAGSDFWKMMSPSGSQASGEIGRRTWMTGSKAAWKRARQPEQEAERRADQRSPSRKPFATRTRL